MHDYINGLSPFRLEETQSEEQGEVGIATVERPDEPGNSGTDYRVILYNDAIHSVDEVIEQIVKATGCTIDKAVIITIEAHEKGRAICFNGARGKCHEVARVLREIRLQCEVDCD